MNKASISELESAKKMIRKALSFAPSDLTIYDITKKAPIQIPGLKFYESQHTLNKDPVPVERWVYDGKHVLMGDELINVLKEKNIFPKTKEEAIKFSELIVFARDESIYGKEDSGGKYDDPVASKKDGYYEVILYSMQGRMLHMRISKLTINLGENTYEVNAEDKAHY